MMTECANTGECQGLSVWTGGLYGRLGYGEDNPKTLPSTWLPPVQNDLDGKKEGFKE